MDASPSPSHRQGDAGPKRLKALTALLLFSVTLGYAVGRLAEWEPSVFADAATVLGVLAAVLWIAHDVSGRAGRTCDRFFSQLNARVVTVITMLAFLLSVGFWIVASNGLYLAFIRYVASKGVVTAIVVSALTRLLFLATAVGLFFYIARRLRVRRVEPFPTAVEKLLTGAAFLTAAMITAARQDGAKVTSDHEALLFMSSVVLIGASVILFFPATFVAFGVNTILAYVLRAGWWILVAPVSAGEVVREAAGGHSVTLGVVFVLTIGAASTMVLSLALDYLPGP